MVNAALKYYQNAVYHTEIVRKIYSKYMKSTNLPNIPLSVMDIGSGSGRIFFEVMLPMLPKNVKEIVGSDMDERMVEFCRSMNKDPKITFEKLNIEKNEVPKHLENRFHLQFSSYCFTYVRNLRQAFANTSKLLKSNGELICLFQFQTNALYSTYREMSKMDKWKAYTTEFANYTPHFSGPNPKEELKKLLKDNSLTILDYEFDYDLCFTMSKREVFEVYKSLDHKLPSLQKDQQKEFLKDFLPIFCEKTEIDFQDEKTLDDQIQFNFPTVSMHARKEK